MKENNIYEEIEMYKRINRKNDRIIVMLLIVLALVSTVAIYVRFFS